MTIFFRRVGGQVQVVVRPYRFQSSEPLVGCLGDMPSEALAMLTMDSLSTKLKDALAEKARLCYERGWHDARGHKRKLKHFYGDFDLAPETGVGY